MAQKLYEESNIQAIAEAIRAKNGLTTTYKPSEMAAAIEAIEVGSGSSVESNENALLERTLTGVYRNTEITKLGQYALAGCGNKITGLDLPNCTLLDSYALRDLSGIQYWNLPKLKQINANCWYSMYDTYKRFLTNDMFPVIESISDSLMLSIFFKEEILYLPSLKNAGYCMLGNSRSIIKYANLPNVTSVGNQVFQGSIIEKAWLPKASTIPYKCFDGCKSLVAVVLRSDKLIPLGNTNAFTNSTVVSGTGFIYVPSALVDKYKAATNWSIYADAIRAIEDYPDICAEVIV